MNLLRLITNKTLWVVMTIIFLGVMFLSLFPMFTEMSMSGGMSSDCPFMAHEEVICSMSAFDHLSAWKSAFIVTLPSLTLLLLVAIAFVIIVSVAPNLLQRQRYKNGSVSRSVRERTYAFSYRPLQELFSNGILHPKLF